jgi:hypothetical protein
VDPTGVGEIEMEFLENPAFLGDNAFFEWNDNIGVTENPSTKKSCGGLVDVENEIRHSRFEKRRAVYAKF